MYIFLQEIVLTKALESPFPIQMYPRYILGKDQNVYYLLQVEGRDYVDVVTSDLLNLIFPGFEARIQLN